MALLLIIKIRKKTFFKKCRQRPNFNFCDAISCIFMTSCQPPFKIQKVKSEPNVNNILHTQS